MAQAEFLVKRGLVEAFLTGKKAKFYGHNAKGDAVWKSTDATYVVTAFNEVQYRVREIKTCAC